MEHINKRAEFIELREMAGVCKSGDGDGARVVQRVCRGQRERAPRPPANDTFQAAASGDRAWLSLSLKKAQVSPMQPDKQGLTVLHMAGLNGRLDCMKLLLESGAVDVNARCPRGRRPIHMVLTAQSRPHSHACLLFLMECGAQPNVATDAGLTPLHLAATEGLWECTEELVQAGADISLRDSRGHTPLDLARIWCHRRIARFLKDCMWHEDKKRDAGRHRALQTLHQGLVDQHRRAEGRLKGARQKLMEEKVAEWSQKKGLPLLWTPSRATRNPAHPKCLSPEQEGGHDQRKCNRKLAPPQAPPREAWNISPNPNKPPPGSIARPQGVRMSSQPEEKPTPPEPDLRHSVTLWRANDRTGRPPQYTTEWDGSPRPVPPLPWDTLQRTLFPAAYPSRMASPCQFLQPNCVMDLPRRGCTPGHSASPWTEVAMHLVEELEPGHY